MEERERERERERKGKEAILGATIKQTLNPISTTKPIPQLTLLLLLNLLDPQPGMNPLLPHPVIPLHALQAVQRTTLLLRSLQLLLFLLSSCRFWVLALLLLLSSQFSVMSSTNAFVSASATSAAGGAWEGEKLTSDSQGARVRPERSSGSQADSQASFHSSLGLVESGRRRAVKVGWEREVRTVDGSLRIGNFIVLGKFVGRFWGGICLEEELWKYTMEGLGLGFVLEVVIDIGTPIFTNGTLLQGKKYTQKSKWLAGECHYEKGSANINYLGSLWKVRKRERMIKTPFSYQESCAGKFFSGKVKCSEGKGKVKSANINYLGSLWKVRKRVRK